MPIRVRSMFVVASFAALALSLAQLVYRYLALGDAYLQLIAR